MLVDLRGGLNALPDGYHCWSLGSIWLSPERSKHQPYAQFLPGQNAFSQASASNDLEILGQGHLDLYQFVATSLLYQHAKYQVPAVLCLLAIATYVNVVKTQVKMVDFSTISRS